MIVQNFICLWMVFFNIVRISLSLVSPRTHNCRQLYYNFNDKITISKKMISLRMSCGKGSSRASAVELGTCDRPLEIPQDLMGNNSNKPSFCYFDKRSPCQSTQRCPIDDRFCGANRDYFDHVYGSPKEESSIHEVATEEDGSLSGNDGSESGPLPPVLDGSPSMEFSSVFEIPKRRSRSAVQKMRMVRYSSSGMLVSGNNVKTVSYSSSTSNRRQDDFAHQLQHASSRKRNGDRNSRKMKALLSKKERRLRRKKLFLMSTWLEDLLPDPHQGSSWFDLRLPYILSH